MSRLSPDERARLLERARAELPEPGDPRRLLDDLLDRGLHGAEALGVLARTSLAWTQLRDLRLQHAFQSAFGWFMARNLMLFGLLVLLVFALLRPPLVVLEGALVGAAAYYLLVLALGPLRLSGQRRRREAILRAYAADLGAYLEALAEGREPPS